MTLNYDNWTAGRQREREGREEGGSRVGQSPSLPPSPSQGYITSDAREPTLSLCLVSLIYIHPLAPLPGPLAISRGTGLKILTLPAEIYE